MRRTISHTIEIDAGPSEVWKVLAETDRFGEWNPFIRRLDGALARGERIVAEITPPGGRAMKFRPTVLAAEPGRELRWLGHLGVPGVFDGEHAFRIEATGDGGSRFTQSESFSGLLVRPFAKALDKTEAGFRQMNEALRERVEAAATSGRCAR